MSKGKPSRPLRGRREIRSSPMRVGEIRVPLRKKDRTGKTAILIFVPSKRAGPQVPKENGFDLFVKPEPFFSHRTFAS